MAVRAPDNCVSGARVSASGYRPPFAVDPEGVPGRMDSNEIIRNPDGTLTVPVVDDGPADDDAAEGEGIVSGPATMTLHPGEGGYDEALAAWDMQQDPD